MCISATPTSNMFAVAAAENEFMTSLPIDYFRYEPELAERRIQACAIWWYRIVWSFNGFLCHDAYGCSRKGPESEIITIT